MIAFIFIKNDIINHHNTGGILILFIKIKTKLHQVLEQFSQFCFSWLDASSMIKNKINSTDTFFQQVPLFTCIDHLWLSSSHYWIALKEKQKGLWHLFSTLYKALGYRLQHTSIVLYVPTKNYTKEELSWPFYYLHLKETERLPWRLIGKESTCQSQDTGLIPGSGRSPGEGNGNPFQYSCLGNPRDRGTWQATVHRITKETWLGN